MPYLEFTEKKKAKIPMFRKFLFIQYSVVGIHRLIIGFI